MQQTTNISSTFSIYCTGYYGFAFNGKENDNEVKGTGNSLDFGARIYDSRTGKFLSIDSYFRNFPNETNYSFAGNCPIKFIDYKGNFKWDAAEKGEKSYAEQYPMITLYLTKYIEDDIKNNKNIINALTEYGETTRNQVVEGAKWGNLPKIKPKRDMFPKGQYIGGDSFTIDAKFLTTVENKLKEKNLSEKEKQVYLVDAFATILDEYTHYLQNLGKENRVEQVDKEMKDAYGNNYTVSDQGNKTLFDIYGGLFNTTKECKKDIPCNDGDFMGLISPEAVVEKGENLPKVPNSVK